ncbi:hypothetical protein [Streptomyces echinatus]|uniref:hypothetical protein n=1 Tax=Streptomyces echinatus TaxID=67293 RepID=UPI0031EE28AF
MTAAGYLAVDSGAVPACGSPSVSRGGNPRRGTSPGNRSARCAGHRPGPICWSNSSRWPAPLAARAELDGLGTAVVGAAGFATLGDALRAELPRRPSPGSWAYAPWRSLSRPAVTAYARRPRVAAGRGSSPRAPG